MTKRVNRQRRKCLHCRDPSQRTAAVSVNHLDHLRRCLKVYRRYLIESNQQKRLRNYSQKFAIEQAIMTLVGELYDVVRLWDDSQRTQNRSPAQEC